MQNKLLVSYSFPTTNKKHHSLVQQFSYLEKVVEEENIGEIIFISINLTNCDLKKVLNISEFKYPNIVKNVSLGNYFLELLETEKTWNEVGEKLAQFILNYLGDTTKVEFYIFGGIIQRNSSISELINYYGDNFKSKTHISTKIKLTKIFLYNYFINILKLKTHHIVFDPQELDFSDGNNYTKYHNYDDQKLKLNRLDSLQYFLKNKCLDKLGKFSKDLEFTFGASLLHGSRLTLHSTMLELLSLNNRENYKVLYQTKFLPEYKTFVDRPEYLKLIQRSKFTVVLLAYEENSFSASRFIESSFYRCVPLLWSNSNYHLLESLGFSAEWLEKNLVVSNVEEIQNKIETLDFQPISDFLYNKLFPFSI